MASVTLLSGRTRQVSFVLPNVPRRVAVTITLDPDTFHDPTFTLGIGFEYFVDGTWRIGGPLATFVGQPLLAPVPIVVSFSTDRNANCWVENGVEQTFQGKTIRPFVEVSRDVTVDVTASVI